MGKTKFSSPPREAGTEANDGFGPMSAGHSTQTGKPPIVGWYNHINERVRETPYPATKNKCFCGHSFLALNCSLPPAHVEASFSPNDPTLLPWK